MSFASTESDIALFLVVRRSAKQIAQRLYPAMLAYFEGEDGKREFSR